MRFVKLSAAGNDFILIDNRRGRFPGSPEGLARKLCSRRVSVGADGLILVEKSRRADFSYRHFNADGSEVRMCGNGARAVCRYVAGQKPGRNKIIFEIGGVLHTAGIRPEDIELHLPAPTGFQAGPGTLGFPDLEEGGFLLVGVPHFVLFTRDLEAVDVAGIGRSVRNHAIFPQGANVNFVQVTGRSDIRVRTFERGVEGETQACGTGTVAAALIAHMRRSVHPPVRVTTRGGPLIVDWDDPETGIRLTGDAKVVYRGDWIGD